MSNLESRNLTGMAVRLLAFGLLAVLLLDFEFIENRLLFKHLLQLAVSIWLLAEVGRIFVKVVIHNNRVNDTLQNLLATGFTVFAFLVILECVFMFVPQSHGVGYTYGAKNWFDYYWRTNELGFRDKSINDVDKTKPKILVVGDSFTAGHGIRHPEETFVGQLREIAGPRYEVLNVGRNGADTREEYVRLLEYPFKPDILILQYFGNDIQKAANDSGIEFPGFRPYSDLAPAFIPLVKTSYLLNYLYWQFPHTDGRAYLNFLEEAYRHPLSMEKHIADLEMFVTYARERSIPLLVVVFPFLRDVESSTIFTEPVGDFFAENGIQVIDVGNFVTDMPVAQRVINHHDGHPSPALHGKVADIIWVKLESLGWAGNSH